MRTFVWSKVRRSLQPACINESPINDPDSYFASVDVADTPAVMLALRAAKVQFSVSTNPTPAIDESGADVFWFWRGGDIARIQQIIREAAFHSTARA